MTGGEIREVFGNKEPLGLEALTELLSDAEHNIKVQLDKEWDEEVHEELVGIKKDLRNINRRMVALQKKYTSLNDESREVGRLVA